jgi:hypothetical protein
MSSVFANLIDFLPVIAWVLLWGLGGIWIAQASFTLRRNELAIAGFGLGLVLENWLANLLAQVLPVPNAFWVAGGFVFLAGIVFKTSLRKGWLRQLVDIPMLPLQWLLLLILSYVFISVGRGLAILDDFQNLPVVSLIATGDIPPHFALNPNVSFGYHYFTMLFAAQLIRIADLNIWTGMDVARGLGFAIQIMLAGLFVQRFTSSRLGGFFGGLMATFAGGTRWLLLLLPPSLLAKVSEHVSLLGSGVSSGPDLASAMLNAWGIAGGGPYPFPFAYVNGYNGAEVMTFHAGAGGVSSIIVAVLLLTHNKWRGSWRAWVVITTLVAALGLANEVALVTLGFGFALITIIHMIRKKSFRLPNSLWRWLVAIGIGGVIALFQGGVITALFMETLNRLLGLGGGQAYHNFSFSLFWPPAILSSHLGYLYLNDPYQILAAAAEIGPLILLLPLVIAWGIKAFRHGRWYESAVIGAAFISLPLSFVELSGIAGITALTRVQSMVLGACKGFGIPALWMWARNRQNKIKIGTGILAMTTMLGGLVLFGVQLIAVQLPVYSDFLNVLDARAAQDYWNKLEVGAMVFDPNPTRAPVVFGRVNNSSVDYYDRKPEWLSLYAHPDPVDLFSAGYQYAYIDREYWEELSPETRELLEEPCIIRVATYEQEFPRDFRWLLDLHQCK